MNKAARNLRVFGPVRDEPEKFGDKLQNFSGFETLLKKFSVEGAGEDRDRSRVGLLGCCHGRDLL